jgi:hypothetical protein
MMTLSQPNIPLVTNEIVISELRVSIGEWLNLYSLLSSKHLAGKEIKSCGSPHQKN